MRVVGLLPWFQENPTWLAACVSSLAQCCDHVVAVDGAYFLYPGARERPRSGTEQAEAILETAHGCNLSVTLHVPNEPFYGNEVEKRTYLLQLAQAYATPEQDWLLSVDADMVLTKVDPLFRAKLEAVREDVAQYKLYWIDDRHTTQVGLGLPVEPDIRPGSTPHRSLFRVLHNMRVEHTHYCYMGDRHHDTPDGVEVETVYYWGHPDFELAAQPADLTDYLHVEHRHAFRSPKRMLEAHEYYKRRDENLVERMPTHSHEVV